MRLSRASVGLKRKLMIKSSDEIEHKNGKKIIKEHDFSKRDIKEGWRIRLFKYFSKT